MSFSAKPLCFCSLLSRHLWFMSWKLNVLFDNTYLVASTFDLFPAFQIHYQIAYFTSPLDHTYTCTLRIPPKSSAPAHSLHEELATAWTPWLLFLSQHISCPLSFGSPVWLPALQSLVSLCYSSYTPEPPRLRTSCLEISPPQTPGLFLTFFWLFSKFSPVGPLKNIWKGSFLSP